METVRQKVLSGVLLAILVLFGSCATVGKEFPVADVSELQLGITNQQTAKRLFDPPWRVGWEEDYQTKPTLMIWYCCAQGMQKGRY